MSSEETARAVEALRDGKLVVFPTDTVYGLGVAVHHADSPQALYDAKRREAGKPVAWLVHGPEALDEYGADVPAQARELARRHWPGALTIIVKASDNVPRPFRSSRGTIGLRAPANETALQLIAEVGPIATTSANISGEADPRRLDDVPGELLDRAGCIVRGAQPASGTASTVLDCSGEEPVVLRRGEIMADTTFTVPLEYVSHDLKTTINAKVWTSTAFASPEHPELKPPRAIVQIVHGMSEYIDRYDDFAAYLVDRGFIVCAEDHVGHGGSAADESEYGHMPLYNGKDVVIGDVHTLRTMMARTYPDVPYVMYGHSMGSFITRAYIARHGDGLAACVLSGTGNVPAGLSKFGNALARLIASIKGETHRSKLIDGMGAGAYGKKIKNARTPLDWLSTDDDVVDAYIADEKCGFMFTVGGYATLLDLTAEVVTPECAARVPKDLPVLLVAGDGDPVGDMGKGVQAAAQLLRDAGVRTVDCTIYEGMRHEIHNEIGKERVYDDVATWMEAHV